MAAKQREGWWAFTVNGAIEDVHYGTRKEVGECFDIGGYFSCASDRLLNGPLTLEIVPVEVTVAEKAKKKGARS